MRNLKYAHSFEVVSELPEPLRPLKKLAFNYRWTWHKEAQVLFMEADKQLWEQVEHNPVELIARLSPERQHHLMNDGVFMARLKLCERDLDDYLEAQTWFDEKYPGQRDHTTIAYFCAEFGLSECLPIYSGGLGILAGDHLKAASDLGLPLVGVGLLYARRSRTPLRAGLLPPVPQPRRLATGVLSAVRLLSYAPSTCAGGG